MMGFFFPGRSVEDDEVGDEEDKSKLVTTGENFYGGVQKNGVAVQGCWSFRKRMTVGVFAFSKEYQW
jgi:hypothetical protein